MIRNINVVVIIVTVYFLGLMSGMQIQNVGAVVKAPNDNNQPVTSNAKPQPAATSQPASTSPPAATKKPESKPAAAAKPAKKSKPVAQASPAPEATTAGKDPSTQNRPVSPPAATPAGATLYSVSSSMLIDIQRMEQDLAALKYKVYIVSNMRN